MIRRAAAKAGLAGRSQSVDARRGNATTDAPPPWRKRYRLSRCAHSRVMARPTAAEAGAQDSIPVDVRRGNRKKGTDTPLPRRLGALGGPMAHLPAFVATECIN